MKAKIVNAFCGFLFLGLLAPGGCESGLIREGVAAEKAVKFENEHYICRLTADDANRLQWGQLYNKNTQTDYLYGSDNMPIFRVLGEDGTDVDSTDFLIDDISVIQKGRNQSRRISLSCPGKQLEAVLKIDMDDTEEMRLSLSVKNTAGSARKLQPIFPLVGRVRMGTSLTDDNYFYPWRSGLSGSVDCYLKNEYGNWAWMQVMSVFEPNSDSGLYTYPMDDNGGFKGLLFKKVYSAGAPTVDQSERALPEEAPYIGGAPGSHQKVDVLADVVEGIAFTYYYPMTEIAAAGEYNLPVTVLGIYKGGWKKALSDYSKWAHTWYKHVDTPLWFRDCFTYVPAWPGYYYSESQRKYICSEKTLRTDILQWAHWYQYPDQPNTPNRLGLEKFQPGDFYYNKDRGGLAAFKAEIEALHAKKTRMTVYVNDKMCYHETDTGQAHGKQWAQMDLPGRYATWGGANEYWIECLYEPNAWPDYIAKTCARIIRDTGMDGIYLDEMPALWPCYNANHIHYQEDGKAFSVPRMVDYIKMSRDAIRSEYSDGILMTEHAGSDYFSQFIDSSWVQTFYSHFSFAEQYYDENSLYYFRFCFPEFKLAEWGPNKDAPRRCFFNGIGLIPNDYFKDYGATYLEKTSQVLRENGDAITSLRPEPLVETKVNKVLANKFPIANKTVYMVYNKNDKPINTVIMEVDARAGYHFVETLYDNEVKSRLNPENTKELLETKIKSRDVICISQLPKIIQTKQQGVKVVARLEKNVKNSRLVAYLDEDTSELLDDKNARIIELKDGRAVIAPWELFGRPGKLILKLYQGDFLLDEVIVE